MFKALLEIDSLVTCRIIKRLTRFTLLVEVDGRFEIAYTNNTGRLKQYFAPNRKGLCAEVSSGKLKYRVIGVEEGTYAALVDVALQEKAFLEAQKLQLLPWLLGYKLYKHNYRLGKALIDYAFVHEERGLALVELKSAVMKLSGDRAAYPDAPTERGRKQILALAEYAKQGKRAIVVFISAIPLARAFQLYCCADKYMKRVVDYASSCGVEFRSINVFLDPKKHSVVLGSPDIPVYLDCSDICD